MNLVIFENATYEEEKALVNLDTDTVIMQGDYYHDKIDYKIEGYLEALKDLGYIKDTDHVEREEIGPANSWFIELEFYNDDEE
jgi:hypothetical protein